ncbi:MAG: hypothetical protein RRA92_06675, partial [Gemmatimonadota bacterium]|nr:hypothetical protein [Gemmatimonadota bacterium]
PVSEAEPAPVPPARRPGWNALRAVRAGRVVPVDADLLHRPGPRVGEAARALALALHPDLPLPRDAGGAGPTTDPVSCE